MTEALPSALAQIVEDFQWGDERDRLDLLLYYAENLPPIPESMEEARDRMEQVHECMTPVYVLAQEEGGRLQFYFDVPRESPTVRGYAALLAKGLQGASPEEVLAIPDDFYRAMGLQTALSHMRLNGMAAILAHMKRLALKHLQETPG